MKLSNLVVLATATTSAASHGPSIHVVFNGVLKYDPSFLQDPNARNATFQGKPAKFLVDKCRNELGSNTISGELNYDDTFQIRCDCAHGDTKLPMEIAEPGWFATGTSPRRC